MVIVLTQFNPVHSPAQVAATQNILCVGEVPMVGQEADIYAAVNNSAIPSSTYDQVKQCIQSTINFQENPRKAHAFQILRNNTDQYGNSRILAEVFNDYGMPQVYQLKRDGYFITGASTYMEGVEISAIKPFKPHSSGQDSGTTIVYYDDGLSRLSNINGLFHNKTITNVTISSEDGFSKYTFTVRNSTSASNQ